MKTFYEKPEAEILRWAAAEAITNNAVSGDLGVEDNDGDEWINGQGINKVY